MNDNMLTLLASIGYDEDYGSLDWDEGWLARFDDAENVDGATAARAIVTACHEYVRWAPVIEAAREWRAAEHDVIERDKDEETVSRADALRDILLRRILDALLKEGEDD